MQFHIARGVQPTGQMLQSLVEAKAAEDGVRLRNDAHVCYGAGGNYGGPTLNAHCSAMNKMSQGMRLHERMGDRALRILNRAEARAALEANDTLIGRRLTHTRGQDIIPILEPWQLEAAQSDFFTPYEGSTTEFRIWVYRKRILGTYEKVLRHPEQFKRIGRNYHNGFEFSRREPEAVHENLKVAARDAISALRLDFGAVDLLWQPNHPIVLEVNTAPGVQNDRRAVIQNLAHRIVRWAANGYPEAANGGE